MNLSKFIFAILLLILSTSVFAGNSCNGTMFKESSAVRVTTFLEFAQQLSENKESKILGSFDIIAPQNLSAKSCLEDQIYTVALYSTKFSEEHGIFGYITILNSFDETLDYCEVRLLRAWSSEEIEYIRILDATYFSIYKTPEPLRSAVKQMLHKNIKLECRMTNQIS